jgi:hypothetical protein
MRDKTAQKEGKDRRKQAAAFKEGMDLKKCGHILYI